MIEDMKNSISTSKLFTRDQVCRLLSLVMEHRLLEGTDVLLACGLTGAIQSMWYTHADMDLLATAIEIGVFSSLWDLYSRAFPELLLEDWWSATSVVVDVQAAQMLPLVILISQVKKMPCELIESSVLASPWWCPLLEESIRMVKVNASAKLSARETMSISCFCSFTAVVDAAARHESCHAVLTEPSVVHALEYAASHEFVNTIASMAAAAAGALVETLGRKEGGKTLGQQTVGYLRASIR